MTVKAWIFKPCLNQFSTEKRKVIPLLTRIQIHNYRSIADADLRIGPITVLVGPNGSGKSTFLDVLGFVSDAMTIGLPGALAQRGGVNSLRRWSANGKRNEIEITLTAENSEFWCEYGFALASGPRNAHRVRREFCKYGKTFGDAKTSFEIASGKFQVLISPNGESVPAPSDLDPTLLALPFLGTLGENNLADMQRYFANLRYYSLSPQAIRIPQIPSNEFVLFEGGENSASVLARIIRDDKGAFGQLLDALRTVVTDLSNVRVREVGRYLFAQFEHQYAEGKSPWFDASQESDGTLRLLGILLACYQPQPNLFVAIEEPETALHPGAVQVLSEVLRGVTDRTQVMLTTQSPDLISRFGAHELVVVEKEDGVTRIGPLQENQRDILNKQLFSAGDLLRIEGLYREGAVAA
jgi:predicted ATPase